MTDTVVVISTHQATARYVSLVRSAIDVFWPDRPTVRFLSDGGVEQGDDVYIEPEPRFVPLLLRGVARVRAEFPAARYLFHMLEDHCPLRTCDAEKISAIAQIARSENLAAVSFPTYFWPWNNTDATEYPDGLVRTWRRIDTVEMNGEMFARVPKTFFRYFQVQPTLWRIDYLHAVLDAACRAGIFDPWGFEAMRLPQAEQHYIAQYKWPTVHHGFLTGGTINPKAVDFIDARLGDSIRRRFIRDAVGFDNEFMYRVYLMSRRWLAHIKDIRRNPKPRLIKLLSLISSAVAFPGRKSRT